MGGLETYVRHLVPALLELRPGWRFSVFVNAQGRELLTGQPWAASVELVTSPFLGRRYVRALSELTYLGWLAKRRRVDILHSLAMTAPLWTQIPNVVTIADVIWLHHSDRDEQMTFRLWRAIVPVVARRADRIIAISDAAKVEVAQGLGLPRSRIDVTPLGCTGERTVEPTPESELRTRLALGSGPLVLAVSATRVHKNVGRLIAAMRSVVDGIPDARLVIPGNPTEYRRELIEEARRFGVAEAIRFPGWVSNADLEGLYAVASCFAFPSLREGFGLPVLEAMARGTPVVCSNRSALPEIAGSAALLVDPESTEEIAGAVLSVLENRQLAERLAVSGRERAAQFTWEACAAATIESYERAVAAK